MKTAKVENYCAKKKTMGINIDVSERVCGTCIWYEQYYREGRGNVKCWVPTSTGYCLLHDKRHHPLHQTCKSFESKGGAGHEKV